MSESQGWFFDLVGIGRQSRPKIDEEVGKAAVA